MKEVVQGTAPDSLPLEELYALVAAARRWAEHGRVDDAQAILEGLADLEPEQSFLHTSLGCLFMNQGRNEEALAAFDTALEKDARDVAALTHAGELRLETGDRDRGIELLAAAAALDPEGRSPHANRARTLQALSDVKGEL